MIRKGSAKSPAFGLQETKTMTIINGLRLPMTLIRLALVLIGFMACKTDNITPMQNKSTEGDSIADDTAGRLLIKIGSKSFSATLAANPTAEAFKARLPLTVSMTELNGNEKYYRFPANLPSNPTGQGMIENGDLMLYTSNTLVLFYKTFSTSYPYTRIGRIENAAGLAAALGSGDVTVSFELE
jgi:hypothetical protein